MDRRRLLLLAGCAAMLAAAPWHASAQDVASRPAPVASAAQSTPAAPGTPSAPIADCARLTADVEAGLAARRRDAFLAAAELYETGRCVARDDARAAQYLGEAARGGERGAMLRLARRFGTGRGVPQSYANAGAWLSGKGASDEAIEPWDYSVGYAYSVLGELLAALPYPPRAAGDADEQRFVIEVQALNAARPALRITSDGAGAAALRERLQRAVAQRVDEALRTLPPANRKLLVQAGVAVPVTLRWRAADAVDAVEGEPLMR